VNSIKNKVIAVVAACAIAGAAYAVGATGILAPQKVAAEPVLYNADTVTGIYDNASPAVFEIDVAENSGYFSQLTQGQGSGFLVDDQGHILTNNHVVDGATSVKVVLDDGSTVDATVVGTDAIDDLAVISIDPELVKDIIPLQFADSGAIKPGEMAIAIGTPYGLTDTVTVGIISGLNRNVSGSSLTGMLQTDAAINPGNSGGPLLDVNGMVIGINTAIEAQSTGANGIGFAVPSNVAQKAIPELIAGKNVERPWLGISGVALTETLAKDLNLKVNQGVYIISVTSGSPADKAGLNGGNLNTNGTPASGGDIITAVDGTGVKTVPDLSNYFKTKNVGDTVTLTVLRQDTQMEVNVTLGSWPTSSTTQTPWTFPTPRIPGRSWGNSPTE
jgi:S1-C subfamily serine protease